MHGCPYLEGSRSRGDGTETASVWRGHGAASNAHRGSSGSSARARAVGEVRGGQCRVIGALEPRSQVLTYAEGHKTTKRKNYTFRSAFQKHSLWGHTLGGVREQTGKGSERGNEAAGRRLLQQQPRNERSVNQGSVNRDTRGTANPQDKGLGRQHDDRGRIPRRHPGFGWEGPVAAQQTWGLGGGHAWL